MYIVTIENDGVKTIMHGNTHKLTSGNIVKGINAIDSFSCSLVLSNPAFNKLRDFLTIVRVYNTSKNRYEFHGRVLCANPSMDESGMISKDVTCESFLGFLCDSQQSYERERNWTVKELFTHIIDVHNSQIEDYKKFRVGEITVEETNDNLYLGIQRQNTWETINEKLIKKLGGELRYRVVDGYTYIDYLKKIGDTKSTAIELSRNMKSIAKEKDPSEYITRLIPLGCKLTEEKETEDENGNTTVQVVETEERLDITSVNDGKNYIDDTDAIEQYGLHIGYKEFDDVTQANNLLSKGEAWLRENNRVKIKYAIKALDLSLLDMDIDDFDVGNYYPVKNPLLGISDITRVIKKTINVCEEIESTIEVGENLKTLSDMQVEQGANLVDIQTSISKIENNYVTNQNLTSETTLINSLIRQSMESVLASVSETYISKDADEEYKTTLATELELLKDEILMKFTTTTEQILSVDGELQTKFEELYNYISFAGGAIKLGASDSLITLTIENDLIKFCYNGVVLGSWDGVNFYTGNVVIRLNERFQIGNFAYMPRSDGSVMLLKVGE